MSLASLITQQFSHSPLGAGEYNTGDPPMEIQTNLDKQPSECILKVEIISATFRPTKAFSYRFSAHSQNQVEGKKLFCDGKRKINTETILDNAVFTVEAITVAGLWKSDRILSARGVLPPECQLSKRFIFCINSGNLLYGVPNLLNYSTRCSSDCHNCI
jgi:hypothetical protein